ncbi:hypothetical protein E4U58_002465 [Claviceps cyperi]|nr:hypothetical protein E4U58_002465 [Claviceps cyperi]
MAIQTDITLYSRLSTGPHDMSVILAISALDLHFKFREIDVVNDEHMQDWYRNINPNSLDCNGSIPVITDTLPNGEKITLFETGTILEYLADRYDWESRIMPRDGLKSDLKVISWLYWSLGHFAPLMEQVIRYHAVPEYQPERSGFRSGDQPRDQEIVDCLTYQARRHYRILDDLLLKSHGCMVGDRPTIADIACFTWANLNCKEKAGIFFEEFPNVQRWVENMRNWVGFKNGAMTEHLDAICAAYSDLRIT